ncbi:hypothetical protein IJ596_04730 [bacterium]|nr:hypothetical protein [bacterium]
MNVVTRTVQPSAPAASQVTYDTGYYYYYPTFSLPHIDLSAPINYLGSALFWGIIIFILSQVVVWGILIFVYIFRENKFCCPRCSRIFKYKKQRPRFCPLCGANIDEYIKPH